MTFVILEVCARKKLLPLLFSVCFASWFLLVSAFVRTISFCKKEILWLKIVLITSNTILLNSIHTHTGVFV